MKNRPEMGRSVDVETIDMTADFLAAYGRSARKRLAREAKVSPETVKRWFAGNWPVSRQQQLGELLLAHIERQERTMGEIKDRARLLAKRGL